jgi:hypothetical protein
VNESPPKTSFLLALSGLSDKKSIPLIPIISIKALRENAFGLVPNDYSLSKFLSIG